METIKEESREKGFDLTQTIQELMNSTTSTKNFAALFQCSNSNDSCSNGPSENSRKWPILIIKLLYYLTKCTAEILDGYYNIKTKVPCSAAN